MKSKATIIVAVCLSLFVILSGCVECEKNSDCKSGQSCTADGLCATEVKESLGIDGKFVLPDEVWEGIEFPVDLQIENKGETSVAAKAIKLYLGGITFASYGVSKQKNYLAATGLLQDTNTYELTKVRTEGGKITAGGTEDIDFGTTLTAPEGQKDVTMSLLATLCYPYTTIATASVCEGDIKPGETYLCKSNEDKEVLSSKAPVKVTKVTQSGARQSQTFIIYFENIGGGIAYVKKLDENDKSNCVTSLPMQDKNKVRVKSVKIGTTEIADCKDKEVSLAAGRIVCQYESTQTAVSNPSLTVELEYNYKDEIIKSYKIQGV